MVRNARIRAALIQVGLWVLIAVLIGYFGYHGIHGERGLRAHRSFDAEIAALNGDLQRLETKRKALEARVGRFEPQSVDRDLLDQEARNNLGWLHPNDRILQLPIAELGLIAPIKAIDHTPRIKNCRKSDSDEHCCASKCSYGKRSNARDLDS
jgi:cell division protein FtsB